MRATKEDENLTEEERSNYILSTLNINNFDQDLTDMLKNANIMMKQVI